MSLALLQDSIARNHGQRISNRLTDYFFRDRVDSYHAALLAIACEGFGGEPLAGERPLQVAEADAALFRLPAFVEDRRAEVGHARGVRIHLRGDVEAAGPRAFDHLQTQSCFAQAHAGDVNYVQRRAGDRGVGEDFLHRIDDARLDGAAVADVDVDRSRLAARRRG